MKKHYRAGKVGDVVIKERLIEVLEKFLEPIRIRRAEYERNKKQVKKILIAGNKRAREVAGETLAAVRKAMKLYA